MSRAAIGNALLVVGIVTIVCTAGYVLLSIPRYWGWCLTRLDMRNWTYGTWIGAGAVLLLTLLLFRVWPGKSSSETQQRLADAHAAEEGAVCGVNQVG